MNPDRLCMSCMTDKGDAAVCPACGVAEVEPDAHGLFLPPGTILERQYLLGRVLGHGGFGVTYLGWDLTLERRLAVKEYFPREFATRASDQHTVVSYSGEKEELFYYGLRKFLAEGRALAKFQDHPGIVSGLNYLEANGTAYLVMEYMEGETLEAYLRSQPEGRLSFA
ncbi:MAG: protein kinase, partial [bacterium]|nr:protein kinase [bacterium]